MSKSNTGAAPRPSLTIADAIAMIVGIVIGAGIFRAPSIVAGSSSSEVVVIGLWVAGGAISIVGALCYAELGSAYPSAGGEYHFLSRAYGDKLGFLFAWARMSVVQTGAIAAIAFVFADYASQLLNLGAKGSVIYAAIAVIGVTALNVVGTRESKALQKGLTASLALAMLAVIVAGFTVTGAPPPAATSASTSASGPLFSQLALIFVLLAYGGWNEAAYLTAEMQDRRRNIVRALVIGLLLVTVIYVLLNVAYIKVLGLDGMKASKALAADVMKLTFGNIGAVVLSVIVIAASLSTLNATVFTGARTNYALGRDYTFFSKLGQWSEGANTPIPALLTQGVIALLLVLLSSFTPDGFETMVAYTSGAFWLFFLLTSISLFVLRRQNKPDNSDHFKVPLYPLTPILFSAMCAFMLYSSVNYAMSKDPGSIGAFLGLGVLFAGIPLMLIAKKRSVAAG